MEKENWVEDRSVNSTDSSGLDPPGLEALRKWIPPRVAYMAAIDPTMKGTFQ